MKEQTRPTEQALAGKYQDLNHYCRSQKSCRKTYSGHATNHPHTHTFFYKILKIIQKFQKYIYKKIKKN